MTMWVTNKLGICWTRVRFKMCWCKWGSGQLGDAFLGRNSKVFAKSHKLPHALGCVHCWCKHIELQGGQRYSISSSSKFGSQRAHIWKEDLDSIRKMPLCAAVQHQVLLPPAPDDVVSAKNITCLEKKKKPSPLIPGSTVHSPAKTKSENGACD